jgi:hypothetical protein
LGYGSKKENDKGRAKGVVNEKKRRSIEAQGKTIGR